MTYQHQSKSRLSYKTWQNDVPSIKVKEVYPTKPGNSHPSIKVKVDYPTNLAIAIPSMKVKVDYPTKPDNRDTWHQSKSRLSYKTWQQTYLASK